MADQSKVSSISPLRQRMQEDMLMRGLGPHTRQDYVRHVRNFAAFLGRSPDTAAPEEVRRFQLRQHENGVGPATINSAVSALRFLFLVTLQRRDLSRALVITRYQRKLPDVLSVDEAARLLEAAPGIKYKAALGVACHRPSAWPRDYGRRAGRIGVVATRATAGLGAVDGCLIVPARLQKSDPLLPRGF